jgi:hypothetical protein
VHFERQNEINLQSKYYSNIIHNDQLLLHYQQLFQSRNILRRQFQHQCLPIIRHKAVQLQQKRLRMNAIQIIADWYLKCEQEKHMQKRLHLISKFIKTKIAFDRDLNGYRTHISISYEIEIKSTIVSNLSTPKF